MLWSLAGKGNQERIKGEQQSPQNRFPFPNRFPKVGKKREPVGFNEFKDLPCGKLTARARAYGGAEKWEPVCMRPPGRSGKVP